MILATLKPGLLQFLCSLFLKVTFFYGACRASCPWIPSQDWTSAFWGPKDVLCHEKLWFLRGWYLDYLGGIMIITIIVIPFHQFYGTPPRQHPGWLCHRGRLCSGFRGAPDQKKHQILFHKRLKLSNSYWNAGKSHFYLFLVTVISSVYDSYCPVCNSTNSPSPAISHFGESSYFDSHGMTSGLPIDSWHGMVESDRQISRTSLSPMSVCAWEF